MTTAPNLIQYFRITQEKTQMFQNLYIQHTLLLMVQSCESMPFWLSDGDEC